MLLQLTSSLIFIGLTAFDALSVEFFSVSFMMRISFCMFGFAILYFYYSYSEELEKEIASILYQIYDSKWQELSFSNDSSGSSKKIRSFVVIAMMRANQESSLRAGGFAKISMETLLKVKQVEICSILY